jgi:hypothetical protein
MAINISANTMGQISNIHNIESHVFFRFYFEQKCGMHLKLSAFASFSTN